MAITFVAGGSISATTGSTAAIVSPACQAGDLLIAFCFNRSDAITITPPDGTWTQIFQDYYVSGVGQRAVFWKIATTSSASFNFTKSTTDGDIFGGVIGAWRGVNISAPIDATAVAKSDNASADVVTFPAFNPTATNSHIIFAAFYGNDLTTFADAMSEDTNPDLTKLIDVETSDTNDYSIAVASGNDVGSGAAIPSRTWASNSTTDAANTGLVFAIIPNESTLTTEAVSDVGLTTATGNGTIIDAGGLTITARGVVWNTSTNPTILNNISTVSGTIGVFTAPITGLTVGTTYYVRAYVTTSAGTFYGSNVQFTTEALVDESMYFDINASDGEVYAVSVYVGGTAGKVTVQLGTTGYTIDLNGGSGTNVFEGTYGGLNGLIFTRTGAFDGYIDNVYYVLIVGDTEVDWDLDTLTNVFPIDSSVVFRRIENENLFDRFRVYRYLDLQFKDEDAYVTLLLKKEANEDAADSSKEFLVSNTSGEVLPFINKRVSMLTKNQAMRIGLSNSRLNETFTICQLVLSGMEWPKKNFSGDKIISV